MKATYEVCHQGFDEWEEVTIDTDDLEINPDDLKDDPDVSWTEDYLEYYIRQYNRPVRNVVIF